jgi:hypothetical protein
VNRTMYATKTAGMAAAARSCEWRTRGMGHVAGDSQSMGASALVIAAFRTAPNATKRSPRRLAERLT